MAELDATYAEARERYRALRNPSERGFVNGARAAELLMRYHRNVAARIRKPNEDEALALSRDAAEAILAGGLTLESVDPHRPGNAFRLYDPQPVRDYQAAQQAAADAAAERDRFAREVAPLLQEADKHERMAAIRAALDADDPDQLADALAALPSKRERPNALTTDDLSVAR